MANTVAFGPRAGLKAVSREPSEFRRATRLRGMPWTALKSPPIKILPSRWSATAQTVPLTPRPGANVESNEPLELRRAIEFRDWPLNAVKPPPIIIRPSDSNLNAVIKSFAPLPGLKLASFEPSAFIRAIRFRPVLL